MSENRLRVALLWHMHQPEYREPSSGRFLTPWSYLHAWKDYSDMAAHLEAQPLARATVNFTPVLLDQLHAYSQRLADGGISGDLLLDALLEDGSNWDTATRERLLRECLRAHRSQMIERYPAYAALARLAELALKQPRTLGYLRSGFVVDLLVWYHIAWAGEALRTSEALLAELTLQAGDYRPEQRRALRELLARVLGGLLGRYRALAASGRVELSTSPDTHPILPLLIDFASARDASAELPLPQAPGYPGGLARAQQQLQSGRERATSLFGSAPAGCWPSEGAICATSLTMIGHAGFRWAASSEAVLRNSLPGNLHRSEHLHRVYRLHGQGPCVLFRDDTLSDLIGFQYKDWHHEHAVSDLLQRLEQIADDPHAGAGRVVLIAMDGENAWEHYPGNASEFLSTLYRRLGEHPRILMSTISECLDDMRVEVRELPELRAGSWVYGDLATWIGHPHKNRAWDLLVAAKHAYDTHPSPSAKAQQQLAICEGSDWFWWPGEHNPAIHVAEFERLFREQLAALYRLLGQPVPSALSQVFSTGQAEQASHAVLRPLR